MATNRLLNERMPEEEFKEVVQEYMDYIYSNIPPKHPIEGYRPGLVKNDRVGLVLKHLMNTRSVYKQDLALIPYYQNIEKHKLPETINEDILENGTRAYGYIGSIIDDTTVYPPYPKGDSYYSHVNKKVKIACTYGTFAIYDGYVYLACHVDDDYESYLYVPIQAISWDFSNPVSLLLYELLYYNSTTMLMYAYDKDRPIMQLKPTSSSYIVPSEFCKGLILQLYGVNWRSYQGLQSVWSKYNLSGSDDIRCNIEIGNFATIFKDALEAIKVVRKYLGKYEQELTLRHTMDIANRDRIVNIIESTRQNFEDILSEFNILQFNTVRIILTYFDGSVLSVIKILHELLKYAHSRFGSVGTSRMLHDNIRIDHSIYQYDNEAIAQVMRPLHDVASDDELCTSTMNHILNSIGELGYSVSALKNLQSAYLQLIRSLFMPGPVFLKIIQKEFIQRSVVKYTIRNGLEAKQFDIIKMLPSLHTKRYLDNVLDPTLTINFSSLTPTYTRPGNQAYHAAQKEYCAKPYIDMASLATPEREAFKAFKDYQPVPPDPPESNNDDDDDFMSAEEVEDCIRKVQAEVRVNGASIGRDDAIHYSRMDGLHPFAV